ncbi:MAG: phage major capsid protein, partial [Candidatus Pacebacteria bacterium]|nr:phage major capsid protein [Candidatus Paceibacterota bacterium]
EVPTWSGTSERGELTSEAGEVSEDTSTPFGTKTLGAYKWDSKIIKISSELLEDSALDMASEIGREIGERLGRAETYYVTRGTGSDEPAGMRGAIAESSVSAISYDNLVDLYTAIDPAHLSSPNCAWTIHKAQIAAIRKLKDSNNQPLWQPAMSAGDPDRLFGYPVLFNPYMDSTAVGDTGNERPIIFGDFGRVFLREVRELRLHRLNERYIENDQVGFIAFMRFDSEVADPGENALKALRIEADGGS